MFPLQNGMKRPLGAVCTEEAQPVPYSCVM